MITISLCMIVKNEEKILKRCLDSLKGIYDELIIVDTGSEDSTKEIALEYTDRVYDFKWIDDFSAARNFAMEKATKDYIYMADADEVLDSENREKFLLLKEVLDPQIEIVQMNYVNQLSKGSVYNYDRELRAKLYKRERKFVFIDPIHEVIRENPVVYDSDIDIIHLQEESHASRDLYTFRKAIEKNKELSERLISMYARELVMGGSKEDFLLSEDFFDNLLKTKTLKEEDFKAVNIILAKCALIRGDAKSLLKRALKDVGLSPSSEICFILGEYFEAERDLEEALLWYLNAAFESEPLLNLRIKEEDSVNGLIRLYEELGYKEEAFKYRKLLEDKKSQSNFR